jgi:GrpB-like predicted nucleotidyltransferase (UPF0157 family)
MLIQEYQKSWIEDFNAIRNVIEKALLHLSVSIEHVGSTAVAKLAAKPIIDIDVVLRKHEEAEEVKTRLENIGYWHAGNQGIAGREVFKRNKTTDWHAVLDSIVHHLYVCPADSKELQKHILFRDYLIANEAARIQYQNLKYEIAATANQDRKKYAQLKEERARSFIDEIAAKATAEKKHEHGT